MNIKEYISSGILEAYVLDELSMAERKEVEQNLATYPELRKELNAVEKTLEALAQAASVAPPKELRENILSLAADNRGAKVVTLGGVHSAWRLAAAAAIIFGLVVSYLAVDYRERWIKSTVALNTLIDQNQQIASNYNSVNQRLEKIQRDFSIIENAAFTKVVMNGTAQAPAAVASVYWNAATHEAYVSIQNLKEISKENQYQLWALVDGKPVDMGVFDAGFDGLLKMKDIASAQGFAVTIEPKGGRPTPSMETMQVLGMMPKS